MRQLFQVVRGRVSRLRTNHEPLRNHVRDMIIVGEQILAENKAGSRTGDLRTAVDELKKASSVPGAVVRFDPTKWIAIIELFAEIFRMLQKQETEVEPAVE